MKNNIKEKFNPISAFFIFLSYVILAVYFLKRGKFYSAYFWAAGFVVVASLPYLVAAAYKKFMAYEPKYIFFAGIVVMLFMSIVTPLDKIYLNPVAWDNVMKMLFFGALAYVFAYRLNLLNRLAQRLPLNILSEDSNILIKIPPKFYFLSWFLRTLFFLKLIPETLTGWQIFYTLESYSVLVGLMIDAYLCFSQKRMFAQSGKKECRVFRFTFFLFAELFNGLLSGMSGAIFFTCISVISVYIKARKKIPFLFIILLLFFFVNFVVPFVKTFRESYWNGASFNQSIQYALESFSDKDTLAERRELSRRRSAWNIEMSTLAYMKLQENQQMSSYQNPLDYLLRFVPRFLWPGKPSVDFNLIGRQMGVLSEDDYSTSAGLSLLSGFIFNFGFYGIIIGMFLVGMIMRCYWEWLIIRSNDNIIAFIIYLAIMYVWIGGEQEFYVALHSNVALLFYSFLIFKFTNKRKFIGSGPRLSK